MTSRNGVLCRFKLLNFVSDTRTPTAFNAISRLFKLELRVLDFKISLTTFQSQLKFVEV